MDALRQFSADMTYVANQIISEIKGIASGHKNVDCVFIVGPGLEGKAERFQRLARSQGLSYQIIGDGDSPVTEDMINDARKAGVIGKNTEVFCNIHGHISGGKANRVHGVELDTERDLVSTQTLISWLRRPLESNHHIQKRTQSWSGNIHFVSCHIGKFRDEFKPSAAGEAGLWEQGAVFLHGSGKYLHDDSGFGDVETVIREIALSKRIEGKRPDSIQIMRALMDHQADSITMLGGDLKEPLVMHARKSVKEIMQVDLHAAWRKQEVSKRLELLEGRVSGPDEQRTALMEARACSTKGVVPEKLAMRVFFTRLVHLESKEKLERLVDDIRGLPGLLKLQDAYGTTPLLLYCSLPRNKALAIKRHDVAAKLIQLGADVNSRDRYGRTAIHYAARSGDLELFDVLVSQGADLAALDHNGDSIFHYLALAPERLAIQILDRLKQAEIMRDIDRKNKQGKTALDIAVQRNIG